MNIIAVIPARLQATRFPRKLMQDLGGKSVIVQTYLAVKKTQLFHEIYVVTDSQEIFDEVKKYGAKAIMSQKEHQSGSDRIAEAVENLQADIVVNVQGDEPFINEQSLRDLLQVFTEDVDNQVDLASLMMNITQQEQIQNPNNVKVVTDNKNFALYFSRSVIPYQREANVHFTYKKHIGVYAFRKTALMDFYKLPPSPLEENEKLEQLRYLENGKRIKMVLTDKQSIGIDTPEDLEKAREFFTQKQS